PYEITLSGGRARTAAFRDRRCDRPKTSKARHSRQPRQPRWPWSGRARDGTASWRTSMTREANASRRDTTSLSGLPARLDRRSFRRVLFRRVEIRRADGRLQDARDGGIDPGDDEDGPLCLRFLNKSDGAEISTRLGSLERGESCAEARARRRTNPGSAPERTQ